VLRDRWLCTPPRQTHDKWCAQRHSGDWLLCTPVANYAMSGVHKSTPAAGYCAHQPIVQRAVCTNALGGWAVVHTSQTYYGVTCTTALSGLAIVHTSQSCNERCAQMRSGDRRLCTPAKRTMSGVHKGAQELTVVHITSQ
jgi:hypothetical protein